MGTVHLRVVELEGDGERMPQEAAAVLAPNEKRVAEYAAVQYSVSRSDYYRMMTIMIRKIKTTDYPRLIEIWESAVLSTHDFLKEEDFLHYKKQLPTYFQYDTLLGFEKNGFLIGFMGIAEGNLEMLFIDNKHRGTGVGKELIAYAKSNLKVTKVDVNEQNIQAVGFYKHIGF